ncbi:MAG TPA: hypothetical protein VFM05_00095 [Candidatus Saccharimonadales bacterium]|nr:hypothetical protein [Candidatus Saccharimonadales bacterium]
MLQIIVSAILFCSTQGSQGWKGIQPLHTSRVDVERLLGTPFTPCKGLCSYEAKSEVVLVRYSGDPCTNNDDNRWRVPANTVISVTVNLNNGPRFSSLRLNRKKFTKAKDPELHGYTSYSSAELGVDYSVNAQGRVYSIDWFPSLKDEKALQCGSE